MFDKIIIMVYNIHINFGVFCRMKDCLFKDFYEGFLQLLMLAVPITMGLVLQYAMKNIYTLPITMILGIISLIYSERNIYKNEDFAYNRRIKIEIVISLLFLAAALVITAGCWYLAYTKAPQGNNNVVSSSRIHDYDLPIFLYVWGTLPYIVETIYAFIIKDLKYGRKNRKLKRNGLKFDVTSSAIN